MISTEDCQPPCWKGIIPGETTFEQALDIVQGFEFVNDEGSIYVGDDKSYIDWNRGDRSFVHLFLYENKVLIIQLSTEIGDLGSVVQLFGEPAGYNVWDDNVGYQLTVYYPNHGLVFSAFTLEDEQPISEDMSVNHVSFLESADTNDFPIKFHETSKIFKPMTRWIEYYQWEGFGIDLSDKK
jgi:hypothetical protein